MTQTHFTKAQFYGKIADTYVQQLESFRVNYPLQSIQLGKTQWTYYDSRSAADPLLLLHGGGAYAEAMFPQIQQLAKHFRVIAPNIPSTVKKLDSIIEGLSALLDDLHIAKTHIYGASFGGHLAQIFIRKHDERARDVVLSHTAIPCEHLATQWKMQRRLLQVYPSAIMLVMFNRTIRRTVENAPIPISVEERAFWTAYFDEQYQTSIHKKDILARSAIISDYFGKFTFNSADLSNWNGRMLIIESNQDEVFEEGDRGALLAMYPHAWSHTFDGYSHLATILAHKETVEIVTDFLQGGWDE